MGIWASLTNYIGGNYRYKAGPVGLGVGTENMALEMPGRAVDQDFYSPRYNVRGTLAPLAPANSAYAQKGPDMDLQANGLYLATPMTFTPLSGGERPGN